MHAIGQSSMSPGENELMKRQEVAELLGRVSQGRIRSDLFYLAKDPLPFRTAAFVRPGADESTLAEADAYIKSKLESAGCRVATTTHRVQAFRCNESKPLHHWYDTPAPEDPWYEVLNIHATHIGASSAAGDEIVQIVSHKDSMSWIDSPGAHDNAVGTVASMEIARALAGVSTRRTVRFLFCNEEHTPWTSRFAADAARRRGDEIVAVFNLDALDGKADDDMAAGRKTHAVTYSTPEGRGLAEHVVACRDRYDIPLEVSMHEKTFVNDDDGMFIKAGYANTVMNIGSWPFGDSQYHLPGDVPERVDIENLAESTRLILAAVLELAG